MNDLTIAQAAERRQVAPKTIRAWIAQGYLKAYRIGPRTIRIKADDLEELGRQIPAAR